MEGIAQPHPKSIGTNEEKKSQLLVNIGSRHYQTEVKEKSKKIVTQKNKKTSLNQFCARYKRSDHATKWFIHKLEAVQQNEIQSRLEGHV